jgi:hypothetical protein
MAEFFNQSAKNISDSESTILTSSSDSTIILSILVSNTEGTSASDVSVRRTDSSDTDLGYLAFTIAVPADANVDLLANKYILPSGDKLKFVSSTSGTLDASISYVEV